MGRLTRRCSLGLVRWIAQKGRPSTEWPSAGGLPPGAWAWRGIDVIYVAHAVAGGHGNADEGPRTGAGLGGLGQCLLHVLSLPARHRMHKTHVRIRQYFVARRDFVALPTKPDCETAAEEGGSGYVCTITSITAGPKIAILVHGVHGSSCFVIF